METPHPASRSGFCICSGIFHDQTERIRASQAGICVGVCQDSAERENSGGKGQLQEAPQSGRGRANAGFSEA